MAKNKFLNLYEVRTSGSWNSVKQPGNLAFGQFDGKNLIWANNIEYDIADASVFRALIADLSTYAHTEDASLEAGLADLSTYVYNEVDASIDELQAEVADISTVKLPSIDSSIKTIEDWKDALKLAVEEGKIKINGVDGSIAFEGDKYVSLSAANDTVSAGIKEDAIVKATNASYLADTSLATQGYVEQKVEEAEGDVNDLSTYVHTTVDGSISDISSRLSSASTRLDEVSTRLNDLSTYVYNEVDASIDRLDTSVNLLDASVLKGFQNDDRQDASIGLLDSSVLAAFQRNDVEDASINAIDGSLANLYKVVDSSFKAVDASLKAALKDVSISAIATGNVATITLGKTTEGDVTTTDSYTVTGDTYVKVGQSADDNLTIKLNVTTSKDGIADASSAGDVSVTTSYAVKSYVEDKLKKITGAFVYRGTVAAETDLPTDASAGDVYVASDEFTMKDGRVVEQGDMLFWNGEKWDIVERNLTGAVTSADTDLAKGEIIVSSSDGTLEVEGAGYFIGTDTSANFGTANKVATEAGAKDYIDAQDKAYDASMKVYVETRDAAFDASMKTYVDKQDADYDSSIESLISDTSKGINARIDAISLTADSSTINYLKIAASEDTTDQFNVEAGVVVVDLSTASAKGQGLADAYDVKQAIAAAGGELSAAEGVADASAKIELTSATAKAAGTKGDLGVVVVESEDSSLLKVNAADNKVTLDLQVATLADASNGATGLALAEDVNAELVANEQVVAASFNKLQETLGLAEDLSTSADFIAKFQGRTVSQAVIDLSTDLAALDASLKALDVESTEVADKLLVGVSETDGKIASTAAEIWINGEQFKHAVNASAFVATLDGDDIKVGGSSRHADSSISQAIADLSTAIDNIADNIITGEEPLIVSSSTHAVDDYVAVSATKSEDGNVQLDSSVLVANQVDLTGIEGATAATATGLATDAYVKDQIAYELAWNVL